MIKRSEMIRQIEDYVEEQLGVRLGEPILDIMEKAGMVHSQYCADPEHNWEPEDECYTCETKCDECVRGK